MSICGETAEMHITVCGVTDFLSYLIFRMEEYWSFLENFPNFSSHREEYLAKISRHDVILVSF